jgi:hypothetical protein
MPAVASAPNGAASKVQVELSGYNFSGDEMEFAQAWLDEQIRHGLKKQFGRDGEVIGPELAACMLKCNKSNRPVRQSRVVELAREIEAGRWQRTHQGIAFDRNGILLDGQHRLLAVIRSGQKVACNVDFGLSPDAFKVIDTHAKRKAADALHIQGHANTIKLAAAANVLIAIGRGFSHERNPTITPGEVSAYVELHAELSSYVNDAIAITKQLGGSSVAGLAAGLFLIGQKVQAELERDYGEFVSQLRTGLGFKTENDPIARLRARIIRREVRGVDAAACTIKAWNYWQAEQVVRRVVWRSDEEFPIVGAEQETQ